MGVSVCVCICLQYAHALSGFPPPPLPSPVGTILASVSTCRPGRLCLLSFLAPSVLAAFVHLGTQTANVGVLQAVGVACAEAFSLPLLPGHSYTSKKTLTTHYRIQVAEQTSLSQNIL